MLCRLPPCAQWGIPFLSANPAPFPKVSFPASAGLIRIFSGLARRYHWIIGEAVQSALSGENFDLLGRMYSQLRHSLNNPQTQARNRLSIPFQLFILEAPQCKHCSMNQGSNHTCSCLVYRRTLKSKFPDTHRPRLLHVCHEQDVSVEDDCGS